MISHIDRTIGEDRCRAIQALRRARRLSEQAPRQTSPALGCALGVPTVSRSLRSRLGVPPQKPGARQRPGRQQDRGRGL